MPGIMGHIPTLTFTVPAVTAAVRERDLLGFDDAPAGAGAKIKGMAMSDAAVGEPVTVLAIGVVDLVSGGAIAKGAEVGAGAGSRAVSGGDEPFGIALNATIGPDQRVQVLIR